MTNDDDMKILNLSDDDIKCFRAKFGDTYFIHSDNDLNMNLSV